MRSVGAIAHELCQNAAGRLGMDERDLQAEEPEAGRLVDQLHPGGAQPLELGAEIVDLEGDVVHAGAALREELPDRRVVAERREQLDRDAPTRSDAASTPCSATVSRCSSAAPKSRRTA